MSGLWCDTFDADLLKVVPGAAEALGPATGIELLTYSRPTNGKINGAAAWHTDHGLASFFWTAPEHRPAACYRTDAPVTACTFLEAVRDEWVHSSVIVLNGHLVWRPPDQLMMSLMYDLRGWTRLSDEKREEVRESVRRSLRAAGERATAVAAG